MDEFIFDYSWSKWITARDMLDFERERGHPYEDVYLGTPKVLKDESGNPRYNSQGAPLYATDEFGNIVREHTLENAFEFIWILKRTQDKDWTYEKTLELPADVIYQIWAERAKEVATALGDASKSIKVAQKRNKSKNSGDNPV